MIGILRRPGTIMDVSLRVLYLRRTRHSKRSGDFALAAVTADGVLVVGVLPGIGVGWRCRCWRRCSQRRVGAVDEQGGTAARRRLPRLQFPDVRAALTAGTLAADADTTAG